MSGLMHIRFAPDMPAAAVEVIGPDLESVGRVWLKPNGQTAIEVPSEASFLRVHLPGGRIVTLDQPGSLDRSVSYSQIQEKLPEIVTRRARGERAPGINFNLSGYGGSGAGLEPVLRLSAGAGTPAAAATEESDRGGGATVLWIEPPAIAGPYELEVAVHDLRTRIQLPGRIATLEASWDRLTMLRRWRVVVRVRTKHPVADTIGGYLNRGDLHSAATLAASAETAEDLLQEKVEDPFAAVVGAYLLLRLRRLDLLHDWTWNLATMAPGIPDAAIIRGWHLVHAGAAQAEQEIRGCFAKALAGPLPIFTEGLQLLSEGARLLGDEFRSQLEALNARCGVVEGSSPFTATTLASGDGRTIAPPQFQLDVDYGEPEE